MIDFEGYYLVPPDQVAYIETRRGGGDAQYGLFLGLSGGKELGVWYRTEEARKAAYTKLARQVEIGKRQDREDILYRLRLIEACINKTDKRTLRIWKQLQQLLHLESEETEYIEVTRRRSDRHGGKYHTNYIVCRRCGKLCYRMRRRREKTI